MDVQTTERVKLYKWVPPPEEPILFRVDHFLAKDNVPEYMEVCKVVFNMRNGRTGGASSILSEYTKMWRKGVIEEKDKGMETRGINGMYLSS